MLTTTLDLEMWLSASQKELLVCLVMMAQSSQELTQGTGGVIQYDLGKHTLDGLKRTGSLNSPPPALLTALSTNQAFHQELRTTTIARHLSAIPSAYARPSRADKLFRVDYAHVTGVGDTCSRCDKSQLVHQAERVLAESFVHYGTIASGNNVIKDGRLRDQLREQHDILCFETEAAGIMKNFPCIVVRGQCDYSDSHKNDDWQRYAAAAAAAWAKEFLGHVAPVG